MNALPASLLGLSLLTLTTIGCASSAQDDDDTSNSSDAVTADPAAAVVPQKAIDLGIVLNHWIGGVSIGSTREEVTALLGRPMKAEYDPILEKKEWTYRGLTMQFGRKSFDGDWHVTRVQTVSGKIRTPEGFGVGSYVNRFKAAYDDVTCDSGGGWQGCWQNASPGLPDMTFEHGDDQRFYSVTMEELQ